MLEPSIYQVNLFVHLVAAALWLGLTVNFSLIMVPLIRDLPEEVAQTQMEDVGRRARRLVSLLMVVLIATGLVNLHRVNMLNLSDAWTSAYGVTAMVKICLAVSLFVAFPFIFILVHRYGSDELSDRIDRMNYLHWSISAVTLVIMFWGVVLNG